MYCVACAFREARGDSKVSHSIQMVVVKLAKAYALKSYGEWTD